MCRPDAALFFLIFAIGAYAENSRPFFERQIYLPRCKFDEHILKNNDRFEKEISKSDFVFTGKVSSGDIYYRDNTLVFGVTVRRYFKNSLKFAKTKEVRVLKTLNEGEGVKCRQPIRPKFTAIFIGRRLKNSKDADIYLVIGPVPVTLYNLDRVTAATKVIRTLEDGEQYYEMYNVRFNANESEIDKSYRKSVNRFIQRRALKAFMDVGEPDYLEDPELMVPLAPLEADDDSIDQLWESQNILRSQHPTKNCEGSESQKKSLFGPISICITLTVTAFLWYYGYM